MNTQEKNRSMTIRRVLEQNRVHYSKVYNEKRTQGRRLKFMGVNFSENTIIRTIEELKSLPFVERISISFFRPLTYTEGYYESKELSVHTI